MTLVVSDISHAGCCLVSDTSVATVDAQETILQVCPRARKIAYINHLNIGLGLWGNACINLDERRDPVLRIAVDTLNRLTSGTPFDEAADSLKKRLNYYREGLRCMDGLLGTGLHIAGYIEKRPALYHLCPNPGGRLFHLQREFPQMWIERLQSTDLSNRSWMGDRATPQEYCMFGTASGTISMLADSGSLPLDLCCTSPESSIDRVYKYFAKGGFFHLRNGCLFPDCAYLMDDIYSGHGEATTIRGGTGFDILDPVKRLRSYETLVGEVVDVAIEEAKEDGKKAAAARPIDSLAFNVAGLCDLALNSEPELDCHFDGAYLFM